MLHIHVHHLKLSVLLKMFHIQSRQGHLSYIWTFENLIQIAK